VYNRVASGEPIFADPNEAVEFIETIRETKLRDGWTVLAWCVMSNHFHLVIRTSTVPLKFLKHGTQKSVDGVRARMEQSTGCANPQHRETPAGRTCRSSEKEKVS